MSLSGRETRGQTNRYSSITTKSVGRAIVRNFPMLSLSPAPLGVTAGKQAAKSRWSDLLKIDSSSFTQIFFPFFVKGLCVLEVVLSFFSLFFQNFAHQYQVEFNFGKLAIQFLTSGTQIRSKYHFNTTTDCVMR